MQNVLLTGGLGFIGSHVCVELILQGYTEPSNAHSSHSMAPPLQGKIIIVDDLSNSSESVLDQIQKITNTRPKFYKMNIQDKNLDDIFKDNKIDTVIHLAGLKAVGESISNPIKYYDTNIGCTLNLITCMMNNNCYNLIFSSSATIYGTEISPLTEMSKIGNGITNPYGETKYMIEKILMSLSKSDPKWKIISLRYFNPVGAHESGLIGESPNNVPNNLMPYIMRVAYKNNTDVTE
ncbi:MAG: NAD-dependent epimerase/dehydratase family protein, partial [Nitrososphaeraceae archaeon]|nr:NAD-dependent epimerase/dehydratase family protein [Nitrososphaeraceae archaeon]